MIREVMRNSLISEFKRKRFSRRRGLILASAVERSMRLKMEQLQLAKAIIFCRGYKEHWQIRVKNKSRKYIQEVVTGSALTFILCYYQIHTVCVFFKFYHKVFPFNFIVVEGWCHLQKKKKKCHVSCNSLQIFEVLLLYFLFIGRIELIFQCKYPGTVGKFNSS